MAITSPGIGSGLDVNGIISQLMAIERQPLNKLDTKEASYQASISALGSLKGVLASLQGAVSSLTKAATFAGTFKTSSTNTDAVTASASDGAISGNYSVSVTQLAQSQKLRTAGTYSGVNAVLGSGKITIQFGTTTPDPLDPDPLNPTLPATFAVNANKATSTITIDPTKSTLLDVRDAINNAKAGVSASIVNDGTGYRLAISSDDSGAANSLKITVDDDDGDDVNAAGLSALAFDPAATRNLKISQNAKDALFTVDGIPVVKASNTISDAIDGVTFTLVKEGGSANISVNLDRSGISTAIQGFAKAYNDANKALKEMTSYDPESKKVGVLQGDAAARSIQNQLRSAMFGNLTYRAGGLANLTEIGISFDRNGAMALDQTKLNAAINDPAKDVATLFTGVAKLSDSKISALAPTGKVAPGRYDINVTQLATQGFSVATLSTKTVTAGVNDSFGISIDGIATSITLPEGNYTGTALAAQIQSQLNGVASIKSAGSSVTVAYANTGTETLTITSAKFGSLANVNTISSGLFSGSVPTPGTDIAGSIGEMTATGSGQELSADGAAKGIRLKITSGGLGDRGTVTVERGFAERLNEMLDGMLGTNGTLAEKTKGLQDSIKSLDDRRGDLGRRLTQIEARYRRQFTSLDTLMSQMTATQSALQQQLAGLARSNG